MIFGERMSTDFSLRMTENRMISRISKDRSMCVYIYIYRNIQYIGLQYSRYAKLSKDLYNYYYCVAKHS